MDNNSKEEIYDRKVAVIVATCRVAEANAQAALEAHDGNVDAAMTQLSGGDYKKDADCTTECSEEDTVPICTPGATDHDGARHDKAKGNTCTEESTTVVTTIKVQHDSTPPASLTVSHDTGDKLQEVTEVSEVSGAPRRPRPPQQNVQPGAFHSDGRNARDIQVDPEADDWSAGDSSKSSVVSTDPTNMQRDVEVLAELVDPEKESSKIQQLVDREVTEALEQERQKQRRNTKVAQVVRGPFWCSSRGKIIVALVVTMVVVAIVLGTVLPRVLKHSDESTPSALPALRELLSSVSPDDGVALRNVSTPQYTALYWLANNVNLGSYSNETKIQRYSLATLFYGTNGFSWEMKEEWLSDHDECSKWYTSATESICSDDGTLLKLALQETGLSGTVPWGEVALLTNLSKRTQFLLNAAVKDTPM